jgi:hypothetical protein
VKRRTTTFVRSPLFTSAIGAKRPCSERSRWRATSPGASSHHPTHSRHDDDFVSFVSFVAFVPLACGLATLTALLAFALGFATLSFVAPWFGSHHDLRPLFRRDVANWAKNGRRDAKRGAQADFSCVVHAAVEEQEGSQRRSGLDAARSGTCRAVAWRVHVAMMGKLILPFLALPALDLFLLLQLRHLVGGWFALLSVAVSAILGAVSRARSDYVSSATGAAHSRRVEHPAAAS